MQESQLYRAHVAETDSTNSSVRRIACPAGAEGVVLTTDFQTHGRGAGANRWESERGRNLLFSVLLHPTHIAPSRQFVLTEVLSLALRDALASLTGVALTVKWPNDIYAGDKKLVGVLIENTISGQCLATTVMGVGVNVNQTHFVSDAPNPTSVALLTGHEADREALLRDVVRRLLSYLDFTHTGREGELHALYLSHLYRRHLAARYADHEGAFTARLTDVEPEGFLVLTDTEGRRRRYAFKEVSFIL